MKRLEKLILVQFFLFDAEEIPVYGNTAWLGPNGAGKTSILDAIQIAMLGAHKGYLKFNTQSVSTSHKKNYRSIRDYCLGVAQSGDSPNAAASDRRRDVADTYITLVFRDDATKEPVSVGVALHAQHDVTDHAVKGLYVLPGVALGLADFTEIINGEGKALLWKDFEHGARAKCLAAGRTPELTDKPETYIREMLHALQPKAKHINPREFMKALKKSVTLRDIESVNDFVRDFLIEAHPIQKHKAMAQIEEFKKLDELVKRTQVQIRDLTALGKRYDRLAEAHREMATMDYMIAAYGQDELELEQERHELAAAEETRSAESSEKEAQRLEVEAETMREVIRKLQSALDADPASRRASDIQESLDEASKSRLPHAQAVNARRLELAGIFERLNAIPGFTERRPEVEGMAVRLGELARLSEPDPLRLRKTLEEAVGLVTTHRPLLGDELPEALQALNQCDQTLKGLLATYGAMDKHGVRLGTGASRAIELLAREGIQATPVCSLVRVTRHEWQPAIEAFLGRNRESLVIEGRREREAVRILRSLPQSQRLYDVTVIQPEHLRQSHWSDPEGVLVGSLIEGDNPVAVDYLRMLLGKTRQVRTEEELEKHSRSMTVDGMLSANGGTRAIRLVSPEEFLIGTRVEETEKNALSQEIQRATRAYNEAKSYHDAIDKSLKSVDGLGDLERYALSVSNTCTELARLDAKLAEFANLKANLQEDDRIVALRQSIKAKDAELKKLVEAHKGMLTKSAQHQTNAKNSQAQAEKLQSEIETARAHTQAAMKDADFDPTIAQRVEEEHESRSDFPHSLRRKDCEERRGKASRRAESHLQAVTQEFDRYLAFSGITLIEERQAWRKAMAWAADERERLEGTQLALYQEEVENAKRKAEEAFRSDVAIKISEAIQQTKNSLAELNKILDTCPPFSNGEKYAFEHKPAEAYKSLYEYIERASQGTDLFSGENEAYDQLIDFLKQSSDPDAPNTDNPLDDYRLLFNFDLLIKQDGKVVNRLSKRVGPGSNGEHRTPFYVIAGAALASAYRIRAGETNTGAALMLLDEAFHGMDSQNSLAAAKFLRSLGLQLLIAAPDTELGKFAPICDTAYELMRFGLDVYIEPTIFKEAAHDLMTSDMPVEHPELIDAKVIEMESEA